MDPEPYWQFSNLLVLLIQVSGSWVLNTWLGVSIVLGLLFSALFSGAEVALFTLASSSNDEEKSRLTGTDGIINSMLAKPRRLLATILIGNTFANVITSVAAAVLTANLASEHNLSTPLIIALEILVVTFVILILSEITPKTLAINNPRSLARLVARPLYVFFVILAPFSKLLANSVLLLEKRLPKPEHRLHSADIRTIAQVSNEQGTIKGDEQEIIENVIEFGNTTAKEIMTSRVKIQAVSVNDSLEDVLKLIQEEGFSRMPLYEDDIDHIIGIVFAKDVLPYLYADIDASSTVNWRSLSKPALFIPGSKKLDDLLREFQHRKTHMAIVVDEYGGTEGVVTLDDLLEEIIGDFDDEFSDTEEAPFIRLKNGQYLFDSAIDLDDMEEVLNMELTSDQDEYETLGGLVYHMMERLPKAGEMLRFKNLELTVHTVEKNRIRKVRVRPLVNSKEI